MSGHIVIYQNSYILFVIRATECCWKNISEMFLISKKKFLNFKSILDNNIFIKDCSIHPVLCMNVGGKYYTGGNIKQADSSWFICNQELSMQCMHTNFSNTKFNFFFKKKPHMILNSSFTMSSIPLLSPSPSSPSSVLSFLFAYHLFTHNKK